jgi:tRNA nucleotidyltransferase (CCA-adding enzyme)
MRHVKIFLVGGAVRDQMLGRTVTERDWVVTGATPAQMTEQGFRPVGQDFPVFLHPDTAEEYALARTERKQGHGYHGFVFNTDPSVTIEQDLARRDLTINAMARSSDGNLVDPYGGRQDLKARWLRHVSPAFAEDPLRVLRVARFAARYHWLGFRVAPETLDLMTALARSGELQHLTPERVWKEVSRALMEPSPSVFFATLEQCQALAEIMPELQALRGVPQPAAHHPEIDTLTHQYLVLEQCAKMQLSLTPRFAALVHDLGKAATPKSEWPQHIAHEKRSVDLARQVARRWRVPNDCRDLGVLVAEYHTHCHRALELKPATVWKVFRALDLNRKPERLEQFLDACEADARGRTGFEQRPYPQSAFLRGAARAASAVDVGALREQGHEGKALGEAIEKARIQQIREYSNTWQKENSH